MKKLKCLYDDFCQNFFSRRLVIFCIFQFAILHSYLDGIQEYCEAMEHPISSHVMTMLGGAVYVVVIYGISIVYFYSNVPYMQKNQMYALIRMGKKQWMLSKMLQIWGSALALIIIEFVMVSIILFPHMRWESDWGSILYTLAETGVGTEFGIMIPISSDLINGVSAMEAGVWYLLMMWLATGLVGMCMLVVSLFSNRILGIFVGALIAFLHIAFENMFDWIPWLSYMSPFTWMKISIHYIDFWYEGVASQREMLLLGIGISCFLGVLAMVAIEKKEIVWLEEN